MMRGQSSFRSMKPSRMLALVVPCPGPRQVSRRFRLFIGLASALLLLGARPVSAALIGYWNLDEGTGTVANDTSGRVGPLNGTLSSGGAGLPLWTTGRFGKGLDFNVGANAAIASGGLVTVPYNVDLRLTGAFTISLWWRPDYLPAASTFPGIIRIGSQSAVPPAANAGWGFFRTQPNTARFKRGNHQPDVWRPAMTVGQWHHVAITHDGSGNNIAFVNGVASATFVTNWPAGTTTANLEMGRMDSFDDAGLDDVALFNEGLSLAKARSLYTVPTSLALDYDLAKMRQLWAIFDAGAGSSGMVDGVNWTYTSSLPGSTAAGDAYISGTKWYVVLGTGAGVSADVQLRGPISPAGIGQIGTTVFDTTPVIAASASFVFDLGSATTAGGGVNDLYEINGDLNLQNNTVVINPTAPLANGTYRLLNYSGNRSGSFNPVVSHQTRYSFTLDESTPGQINLAVSGANADVKWSSTTDASWNLTTANWLNLGTAAADRFFQGDSARFDDSAAFPATINLPTTVFPSALAVNSSTINYAFSGTGKLSGIGQGLTKAGTSTLTLATANDFLGPVQVDGGTLKLGHATGLGTTNVGTTIASGSTLDLAGFSPGLEPISLQGSGLNNTGAVINTGAALVNDGLRGVVTLTGDTTVGGANRWDISGGSLIGNGRKLTKTGASEIALSNLGQTGLGEIDVQQGILTILGTTLPGDPTKAITVRSNAVLAYWATAPRAIDKPLVLDSAQIRNGTTGGTDISTNQGAVNLTGNNTFNLTANVRLQGEVGGAGGITKIGTGTLSLDRDNFYAGDTLISAGRVALTAEGGLGGSQHIFVNSGAVLDVSALTEFRVRATQVLGGNGAVHGSLLGGAGSFISPGFSTGTLAISNRLSLEDNANLTMELGGATTEGGGVNDLITVGGNLSLDGLTTIEILPVGPLDLANPYTLISYTGTLTGNENNLAAVSSTRMTFGFDTDTPGKIRLKVASGEPALAEWSGGDPDAPKLWDVKTTANWVTTIVPDKFYAGDTTVFNDLASEFNVELVGDLFPANTRVEADLNDYVFLGAGRIRGGGLSKSLGGKLTLINSGLNDYPGPTTINGGTIQVGDGGTTGNLGPGPIVNNGRLILHRSDNLAPANTMTGTGVLEKRGDNVLTLPASFSGFDGAIIINGGTARPAATNAVGTATGGTTAANGGTLDLNGLNLSQETITATGAGVGNNGAIINSGAGQNNALRYVILAGDATFGGSGRWDLRNPGAGAALTGNGFAVTKVGANQISFVGLGDTGLGNVDVRQGTLSVESSTALGLPDGTVSVQSGATLMFWGSTAAQQKQFALINGGRIFKDNGTVTLGGTLSLTGSNALESANNSGLDMTITAPIGGSGSLTKLGAGNVILTADNNYAGGTLVSVGNLYLGNGGTVGSIQGNAVVNGGLFYHRSDLITLANNLTGVGSVYLRTAEGLVLDATAQINLDGSTGGGNLEVGRDVFGRLIIRDGARPVVGRINVGNIANTPGEVIQLGGNVIVSLEARVGHWATETSTYILGGGTLSLTNVPTGSATERNGILYVGVDGTGIFTQTGGVATVHGLILDNRGNTAGDDTFNLEGGTFNVGPSGIGSGTANANTSYIINLTGGRLAATANWSSPLNMRLTGLGADGDVTIDTRANTNTLSGVLSGFGGFIKAGSGLLVLSGINTYEGNTMINEGTLAVLGTNGVGFGEFHVASGTTLVGTGTINDFVFVENGGTVSPGLLPGSIGTLNTLAPVSLSGTTRIDIAKSGAALTSDRLAGSASLTLGGTLTVVATGDALAANDTFQILDALQFAGTFASLNLPPLTTGLNWDVSELATAGRIKVVAPTLITPVISGGNLTLGATGGTPGASYRILASTDVAAPLDTWTEVATGTFDANGNLSVTLPVNPNEPRKYYAVRTP